MIDTRHLDVPRVSLPGVNPEEVSFVQTLLGEAEAQRAHVRRQQKGLALAMVRLGKPIARPSRKKARPTKHVRHMRAIAQRSGR